MSDQAQEALDAGQAPAEATTTDTAPGAQDGQLDAESIMAELRKVRREAAKYRTELRKLQEAQAAPAAASSGDGTDVERLQADLAAARAQMAERERLFQEQQLRSAVVGAAARAGFNDPDDAWRMVDHGELEIDETGQVLGVEDALQTLRKAKPYLVRASAPSVAPTNPVGQRPLTKEQIRAMSHDEINRRWDEVEKALGSA